MRSHAASQFALHPIAIAIAIGVTAACSRDRLRPGAATPEIKAPLGVPRLVDPSTGSVLTTTSSTLDFGRVRLGTTLHRELLVRNDGAATFTLSVERAAELPDAFQVAPAALSVDAGHQVALELSFRPAAAGEAHGSLRLVVENGDPSELTVDLRGLGFASTSPDLEVAPARLDFELEVAGQEETQTLVLANVGIDVPGTTEDNLRFAAREGGAWVEKRPEIVGPSAADFRIEWPPQGYDAEGLSGGRSVELLVHFRPSRATNEAATLVIYSNAPDRPRVEVPLIGRGTHSPCDYEVRPPTLNFGKVDTERPRTLSFEIVNLDPDPAHECFIATLDLTSETRQAGVFVLADGPIEAATIPGGRSLAVAVRFQPRADGRFVGEVAISVASPSRPQARVGLTGIGLANCLMIAPRELDFGTIGVRCHSRERIFTMYNTCSSAVTVGAINLSPSASPEFAITKRPALPVLIAMGGASELGVTYQPVDAGEDEADLTIVVGGMPAPYHVPLLGRGVEAVPQTDMFSVRSEPKVDLLFVIDNSPTMADKQASIASNLASIVTRAHRYRWDYHVAVTTTDVSATGEAGRFVPVAGTNPKVITESTPNGQAAFDQNVAVGTGGSESEALLRPVYLALTDPLLSGPNAGFYRDDARLAVIVISDAADQDPLQTPVADYADFLVGLKGANRRNEVSFSAIVPRAAQAPSGCSYDTAGAGLDTRAAQLAQLTGGFVDDICDADWGLVVNPWCFWCTERTTYFLSNVPDGNVPNPIVVTFDGQAVDAYDASGARVWWYDAANNAIEFADPRGIPSGTVIGVTYYPACLL